MFLLLVEEHLMQSLATTAQNEPAPHERLAYASEKKRGFAGDVAIGDEVQTPSPALFTKPSSQLQNFFVIVVWFSNARIKSNDREWVSLLFSEDAAQNPYGE